MRTAITGGIGSGKSYVCRMIEQQTGQRVYDCDSEAKRLMRTSHLLRQRLTQLIGSGAYKGGDIPPYSLNKAAVARFILASPENAHAVDSIVHPAVVDDFLASGLMWVESALLFEAGLDRVVDRIVVVTAPEQVRISRIVSRDGITEDKAREWIARQIPQEVMRQRAHFEIVNDGTTPLLPQIEKLLIM